MEGKLNLTLVRRSESYIKVGESRRPSQRPAELPEVVSNNSREAGFQCIQEEGTGVGADQGIKKQKWKCKELIHS